MDDVQDHAAPVRKPDFPSQARPGRSLGPVAGTIRLRGLRFDGDAPPATGEARADVRDR